VSLSGQSITFDFSGEAKEVATPSLAVQEAINIAEMTDAAAEFGKLVITITFGIKARVNAANETPKPEAL
jgi:hypothetical protein